MDGNWKLLAEHAARRRAELGLSQIEVAQRGPLSLDRVQSIEGAKRTSYRLGTLLALERALGWKAGSVEAVLAGGDPEPVATISDVRVTTTRAPADDEDDDPKMREAMDLIARAQALLAEMQRERREGA